VVYSDGSTCQDPKKDLTVGASINSTDRRVEGKLVDLDPEQQMVSEIWGFQVGLDVTNAAYNASFGFRGSYEALPFIDIFMRYPQGQSDSWFSAFYQSVLHNLAWFDIQGESIVTQSRFLQELLANGKPSELSIHFNTDGYDDDTSSPWFTFGRVVGTIGL